MADGPYAITAQFEKDLCDYTGARYCCVVDSCSHAIALSLQWIKTLGNLPETITIPKRTFPSVPCEIIHAGSKIKFVNTKWKGVYQLYPTSIFDAALRFTHNMYVDGSYMCISFTGPRKRLKLSKGGAILHSNYKAQKWFIQARMSGRHEVPFMEDNIGFAGWNYYINPELSARGLMLLREFYGDNGKPLSNKDIVLDYPDLSKMEAFK